MGATAERTEARAVRESCDWVEYDRYIGTCRNCKHTFAMTVENPLFHDERRRCPICTAWTKVEQVFGRRSEGKKCDARCLNAKRSSCECSCAGKHHGGGL